MRDTSRNGVFTGTPSISTSRLRPRNVSEALEIVPFGTE